MAQLRCFSAPSRDIVEPYWVSEDFFQSPKTISVIGNGGFLSEPLQFIISHSSTLCSLWYRRYSQNVTDRNTKVNHLRVAWKWKKYSRIKFDALLSFHLDCLKILVCRYILQRSVKEAVQRLQIRKVALVPTVARPVECTSCTKVLYLETRNWFIHTNGR